MFCPLITEGIAVRIAGNNTAKCRTKMLTIKPLYSSAATYFVFSPSGNADAMPDICCGQVWQDRGLVSVVSVVSGSWTLASSHRLARGLEDAEAGLRLAALGSGTKHSNDARVQTAPSETSRGFIRSIMCQRKQE